MRWGRCIGVEVMRRVIDDTALQLPKVAGQYPVLPNNSSDYLANPRLSLLILSNCTSSEGSVPNSVSRLSSQSS